MRGPLRRRVFLSLLSIAAAVSPLTLEARDDGRLVRLRQACGQATECEKSSAFICSKAEGDHLGYRCTKGCVKQQ